MKKLTIHNYESYFLDFIEGNLNGSQIRELNTFLDKNPGLKEELNDFEELRLKPENIIYNHKEGLIKKTQAKHFEINNFEYLCIAEIEKEITDEEKEQLKKKSKKNTAYGKDPELFKKTKLYPDLNIHYPYKKQLIRRYLPGFAVWTSAAAAVIAVFVILNFYGAFFNSAEQNGKLLVTNSRTYRHKPVQTNNTSENTIIQGSLLSHNQTINKTNKNDLVFEDNESQYRENMYKELTVFIPDIKNETLISSDSKDNLVSTNAFLSHYDKKNNKEMLWQIAEAGVNVWKRISSSDLEMTNKYQDDGSLEKLNLTASNFKLSRTFYKK